MRSLGIFIVLVLFSIKGFSQDTLYTKEGKVINGKVTEITKTEIKYKSAVNLDGPSYVIDKSDVVLIHYKNGTKDVFQSTSSASTDNNNSTASNQNSNNNSDPVYVSRPNINVVLGAAPPLLAWGWGGGWGWGWNRPYYGGGYRYYGGHHGWHNGGGGFHGGHYGHRR